MNVLLLYTIEIFPYEQSWYSFYSQVFNFLKKRRNLNINLQVAYLYPASEEEKRIFEADTIEYKSLNFQMMNNLIRVKIEKCFWNILKIILLIVFLI